MFRTIRQISILNNIFNVHENEWSKIGIAWLITLLYRVGFVIGWTIIVASFVTSYGIASLPYLFVVNALFSIIGTLIYSTFLDRISKDFLIIITIFLSSAILFSAYLFSSSIVLFYGLIIVTESLFLGQLRIILNGYNEELFTPIQSERTFPLIESSETIGGIFAGLLVTMIAGSINIQSFLLIWMAVLLLMVPFVFIQKSINKRVKKLKVKSAAPSSSFYKMIKKELKSRNHFNFVKGLFLIVFFQWVLFNLVEFQYTKAVYQNVSNVILQGGSGFEHAFVHDLGQLFALFSASALLVQLFIGSRLINSLGIVGSMMLHPIITLLSVLGLTHSFGFKNAVFTKNNYTITSVIHKNAYHSSYYAIKENLREHMREFLDGIVRPIGAIFGTLVIILMQKYFIAENLIYSVNVSMIVICVSLLFVTYKQQKYYTKVAVNDLHTSKDNKVRFNAIDILSQRGNKSSIRVLTKILHEKRESVSIKIKILKSFMELKKIELVDDIIECLSSYNGNIRSYAIDALLAYKNLIREQGKNFSLNHKIISALELCYKNEKEQIVRKKIIKLLSNISTQEAFNFLLNILDHTKGALKADIIKDLGNFTDVNVIERIIPYLDSKNKKYRLAAIIAMGKLKKHRKASIKQINLLLKSKNKKFIIDALIAISELKLTEEKDDCVKYLNSGDEEITIYSAMALLSMGYWKAIPVIIKYLFGSNVRLSTLTKELLENLEEYDYKIVDKIKKHMAIDELEKTIPEDVNVSYGNLPKKDLKKLKWLYSLVEEYDEVDSINDYLNN